MKKILSLIMTIILSLMCFSACTNNETGSRMKEPEFVEREWSGIEWEKIEFPVDEKKVEIPSSIKAISTKEEALAVGKGILENFWEDKQYTDYVLHAVIHSTKDNIWRFDYSIAQRDRADGIYWVGGSLSVAVNGNNANLIKAWVEE